MKVRCTQLIDPIMLIVVPELPRGERHASGWLPTVRVGQEYNVLAFVVDHQGQALLRLDEDESPGLYDRQMFVTTSTRIPSNWTVMLDKNGRLEFGPEVWRQNGYWDAYFNGDAEAVQSFLAERAVMRLES